MKPNPNPTTSVTVLLIEDDDKVRESLRILLDGTSGISCVGAFGSAEAALQKVESLNPQVVLMDINLPGMSGIDCAAVLKRQLPEVQIVMLTVNADDEKIFRALAAGASGYLLKKSTPVEILVAVVDVKSGGAPLSSTIARKVIQTFHAPGSPSATENLSNREHEILNFLARGFIYKEIADQLQITTDTVHSHLSHIYRKLQVRSRGEAVAKYFRSPGRSANHPNG